MFNCYLVEVFLQKLFYELEGSQPLTSQPANWQNKRNKMILVLIFGLFILPAASSAQKDKPKTIRLPAILTEVSGLWVASPDSLWWHNDGGHSPTLYCTDPSGKIIDKISFKTIKNNDWEDMTVDDHGRIFIGDFGNNSNRRDDLKIYIYDTRKRAIDSIQFRYAEQTAFPPDRRFQVFDMEAFFYHQDSLHLFSKNKAKFGNYQTRHYVLPAHQGNFTIRAVDSMIIKKKVITGACISPDGKTVAMTAYNYGLFLGIFPWVKNKIFIFSEFKGNRFLRGKMRKRKAPGFIFPKQYEALDFWDEKTLCVGTERLFIFNQKAKKMKY